ncbi:hypothetical protein D1007_35125 [Hordeum vulgare]|nr:hypothetical protein D1007_35125 [Hordeum vulgare]
MEVMEAKERLPKQTKGKAKEKNQAWDEVPSVLNKEEVEEVDFLQPYLHLLSPSLIELLRFCETTRAPNTCLTREVVLLEKHIADLQGSGVINDDPEYNPKEDEVVVHKTVKALKESRTKRPSVEKTANKKRKSSEASAAMPPGRVMAPPPGQTKRILEPDEHDRVTRQKATMAAATDHHESPLGMDFESSVEMRDEFPPMDEETTLCMDESGTVCLRLRRGAPSIDRNDVVSEEEQQLVLQPGKFTFSFTSAFCKWK